MTVLETHHTGLHVANIERSLALYRDILGFTIDWERTTDAPYVQLLVGCPGAELKQAMLTLPGSEHRLELIEYRSVSKQAIDPAPPNSGGAHFCLRVDNLRELHKRLIEAGIESVSDPIVVPHGPNRGHIAVYMIDPDGFRLELVEPPGAAP
jgi:catechol 2,3-dioxygenase-like lactoylglutathione lyase family enzyme